MSSLGLFSLSILQSLLLACGQVMLKIGLAKMEPFGWTLHFFRSALMNWQFALSGVCFGAGSLLWMYIIKKYPLSSAYPLISLSYVFGMIAAILVFHENIELRKWIGVLFIIGGCYLLSK